MASHTGGLRTRSSCTPLCVEALELASFALEGCPMAQTWAPELSPAGTS